MTSSVRNLVKALIRPGPYHGPDSGACYWCPPDYADVNRPPHRPSCPYIRAKKYLAETEASAAANAHIEHRNAVLAGRAK